jgi:hypothetical protein
MRIFLISCVFFITLTSSSTIKPLDAVKKMLSVYDNLKSYSVDMKFNLYKGHSSGEVIETYSGFLFRYKKKAYQKIYDTEFVITPEFCAKIVHPERVVELSTGHEYVNQELDINAITKECSSYSLIEQEDFYLVTFLISNTSQIEFDKVILKIYKKNMHLAQVDLFYSIQQNFSKNHLKPDIQKPHLRILYSNFSTESNIPLSVFNYKTYFEVNNSIIKLSKKYENYEFIDNRFE